MLGGRGSRRSESAFVRGSAGASPSNSPFELARELVSISFAIPVSRKNKNVATIEKAIEIAARSHAGMKDKQGKPYLLHPIRVMMGVEGEATQIVAVLHDVVEDTPVTIEEIEAEGFSAEVVAALRLVTHDKSQPYSEYVIACKPNQIAREVKLSDLRDNGNWTRLLYRPDKMEGDSARLHKYVLSYRYLCDEISEDDYRRLMVNCE